MLLSDIEDSSFNKANKLQTLTLPKPSQFACIQVLTYTSWGIVKKNNYVSFKQNAIMAWFWNLTIRIPKRNKNYFQLKNLIS
jgi:hypothetical protein